VSDQSSGGVAPPEDREYRRVQAHMTVLKLEKADYDKVLADLETARVAWKSMGRGRREIFKYLQTVLDIGQRWYREEKGIEYQSLMLKIAKFRMGERQRGRFRVIVYCSSEPKTQGDFRVRNKWVHWLELAAKQIRDNQAFEDFVKETGSSISDAPPRGLFEGH
jgi:hypothetical protein